MNCCKFLLADLTFTLLFLLFLFNATIITDVFIWFIFYEETLLLKWKKIRINAFL